MTDYIVENFQIVFDELSLKYSSLNNAIYKSIATMKLLRTYQDVDNIKDMLKDSAFVKEYYENAKEDFEESRKSKTTNSLLFNGKIRRERVDDNFNFVINNKSIEGLCDDY
jgi:methionine synthase I (cobalamin-dependent)